MLDWALEGVLSCGNMSVEKRRTARRGRRPSVRARKADVSTLILRLGLGPVQIYYGALKIAEAGETVKRFALQFGLPASAVYALSLLQILVGLGITLGFFTRASAACLLLIGAASLVSRGIATVFDGSTILFVAACLALLNGGARHYSLDRVRRKRRTRRVKGRAAV